MYISYVKYLCPHDINKRKYLHRRVFIVVVVHTYVIFNSKSITKHLIIADKI